MMSRHSSASSGAAVAALPAAGQRCSVRHPPALGRAASERRGKGTRTRGASAPRSPRPRALGRRQRPVPQRGETPALPRASVRPPALGQGLHGAVGGWVARKGGGLSPPQVAQAFRTPLPHHRAPAHAIASALTLEPLTFSNSCWLKINSVCFLTSPRTNNSFQCCDFCPHHEFRKTHNSYRLEDVFPLTAALFNVKRIKFETDSKRGLCITYQSTLDTKLMFLAPRSEYHCSLCSGLGSFMWLKIAAEQFPARRSC